MPGSGADESHLQKELPTASEEILKTGAVPGYRENEREDGKVSGTEDGSLRKASLLK